VAKKALGWACIGSAFALTAQQMLPTAKRKFTEACDDFLGTCAAVFVDKQEKLTQLAAAEGRAHTSSEQQARADLNFSMHNVASRHVAQASDGNSDPLPSRGEHASTTPPDMAVEEEMAALRQKLAELEEEKRQKVYGSFSGSSAASTVATFATASTHTSATAAGATAAPPPDTSTITDTGRHHATRLALGTPHKNPGVARSTASPTEEQHLGQATTTRLRTAAQPRDPPHSDVAEHADNGVDSLVPLQRSLLLTAIQAKVQSMSDEMKTVEQPVAKQERVEAAPGWTVLWKPRANPSSGKRGDFYFKLDDGLQEHPLLRSFNEVKAFVDVDHARRSVSGR
jgi:hypothetical protein